MFRVYKHRKLILLFGLYKDDTKATKTKQTKTK